MEDISFCLVAKVNLNAVDSTTPPSSLTLNTTSAMMKMMCVILLVVYYWGEDQPTPFKIYIWFPHGIGGDDIPACIQLFMFILVMRKEGK